MLNLNKPPRHGEQRVAHFYVDFVSAQHNGNVLADTLKITMPVWHIFIRDARRDVEHNNAALALNVVAITETTKLFLASGVPDIEHDRAKVGGEG